MLMGAFFGVLGADKLGSGLGAGRDPRRRPMALLHAVLSIQLRADQIIGGTAINFLALGFTGYLFIDIYGQEGRRPHPDPEVNLGFLDDVPFFGDVFGDLNMMIWVALLLIRSRGSCFQDAAGAPDPRGRRAPAGRRHGRHHRLRHSLRRGRGSPACSPPRRRVSLDRIRQRVHREHDRRPWLHRARGADLRELAPFGAAAACLLFGFSGARPAPAGVLESAAVLFEASRTSSR